MRTHSKALFFNRELKLKTFLSLLLVALLTFSCGSDDDGVVIPPEEELAALIIDCSTAGQVGEGETRRLTNRNNGIDYIIDCVFVVNGDFIIDPGVIIQFGTDAGIRVYSTGSLQAIGTAQEPIIFTSGSQTVGSWKGIFIDSNDVQNELTYAVIDYAGGGSFNSNGDLGSVIVWSDTRLIMKNTIIRNSESYGFNASYGGDTLTLENNTITACNAPMYIEGAYPTTISGGSYIGNTTDAIIVTADQITGDHTWNKLNVPYHLPAGLQVIPGGKLTLNPGVIMEFGLDAELYINEGASGPKPSLIAVGTTQNPILFTGINKTQGAWRGIRFDTPSVLNEIGFATIEYASNPSLSGALYLWYGTVLDVHDVTFRNIQFCAFTTEELPNGLTTSNITYINVTNIFCDL